MSEAMYTLNDVPPRLEPIADVVREEGKRMGVYGFELERCGGLSSLSFYVNGSSKKLHIGMKYLSYLQDNRNVWKELADNVVKELVRHEKNGHFCHSYSHGAEGIHWAMERNGLNPDTEEAYMIHERQANLNELCLDNDVVGERMASKIATMLWSRAIYTPASYMEYLIRHGELKSLCGSHSFIHKLANQDGIEKKVGAVSYAGNHADTEKVKAVIGEWTMIYLDDTYPWLKPDFKKKVVGEVLLIDEEYRKRMRSK